MAVIVISREYYIQRKCYKARTTSRNSHKLLCKYVATDISLNVLATGSFIAYKKGLHIWQSFYKAL